MLPPLLLLTEVATEPAQLELQASTVGRGGGGRIFVLTSDPALANATVSVTWAAQTAAVGSGRPRAERTKNGAASPPAT